MENIDAVWLFAFVGELQYVLMHGCVCWRMTVSQRCLVRCFLENYGVSVGMIMFVGE